MLRRLLLPDAKRLVQPFEKSKPSTRFDRASMIVNAFFFDFDKVTRQIRPKHIPLFGTECSPHSLLIRLGISASTLPQQRCCRTRGRFCSCLRRWWRWRSLDLTVLVINGEQFTAALHPKRTGTHACFRYRFTIHGSFILDAEGEQASGLSYRYKLPIRKDNIGRLVPCYALIVPALSCAPSPVT